MKDRWVLFFAYHFPPENVPSRFHKYLLRRGYRCHVLTAAGPVAAPDTEQVPDPFFRTPGSGLGWQVERAIRKLLLPGAVGTQWALHAFRSGLRFLNQHRDDEVVLFSTFPPLGTHLAAWRLALRSGRPWIADYRDPLSGNPATTRLGRHTQAAFARLDQAFVRTAAAVIANTDAAQAALKSRFPASASKIQLIWNGFDPEERLLPGPLSNDGLRVLSHLGELYEGRTVTPLLTSFKRLIDTGRMPPCSLQVQLIGPSEASCLPDPAFLTQAKQDGWLKLINEQRPKAEAQQIAKTSHGLLIVQPHSAVQVPGKLFEYVQIGRPVLAFVPRDSAIERLLTPAGVRFQCIYPDESPAVIDTKISSFLALDPAPVPASAWFEDTFNAASQTEALAELINRSLHC